MRRINLVKLLFSILLLVAYVRVTVLQLNAYLTSLDVKYTSKETLTDNSIAKAFHGRLQDKKYKNKLSYW